MNTGGNLMRSPNRYLFNDTIGPKQIGFYKDNVSGELVMLLKGKGEHFYIVNPKVGVQCYDSGAKKVSLVYLNDKAPCDCEVYEYGLEIMHIWKEPGIRNFELYPRRVFYGGQYSPTQAEITAGVFTPATLEMMETDIINQITSHKSMGGQGGALVSADRIYEINAANGAGPGLNITINGVTTTLTQTAASTLVQLINTSAALAGKVLAFYASNPSAPYKFFVLGLNGTIFTVTPSGTPAPTIVSRGISIFDKEVDIRHTIGPNTSVKDVKGAVIVKFSVLNNLNTYCHSYSDTTTTTPVNVFNNCPCLTGSSPYTFSPFLYGVVPGTTFVLTGLTVAGTDHPYIAFSFDSLGNISYSVIANHTYSVDEANFTGQFSVLTTDDVFREFATGKFNSQLSKFEWEEKPIKGVKYCKLVISSELPIADLTGANHLNTRRHVVEIYYPAEKSCVNQWQSLDMMNDNPATPNVSLAAIIAHIEAGTLGTIV